ncbi:MAG: DUF1932 domain-containing protein [Devosia sp.]|nr:DUF1932 domain-containing protein [Devosia sp.]
MPPSDPLNAPRIAFVGFGEAARALAAGWRQSLTADIRAYDIKTHDPGQAQHIMTACSDLGVAALTEIGPLLEGSPVVFCLVTAGQSLAAAQTAVPYLQPGTYWFDGNSCAPGTKQKAAAIITAAGGRYVDMAIMAPVHPRLHRTPVLLSGPDAPVAAELLQALGMSTNVAGGNVGDASAIKMIRSVMVKGMEALTAECLLAARRAGVQEAVLTSLQQSDPAIDWSSRSLYNLGRMRAHGARRAAEMHEVASTLCDLGMPDRMAVAAALWHDQIGALQLDESPDDLPAALDQILLALT